MTCSITDSQVWCLWFKTWYFVQEDCRCSNSDYWYQADLTGDYQADLTGDYQADLTGDYQADLTGDYQADLESITLIEIPIPITEL